MARKSEEASFTELKGDINTLLKDIYEKGVRDGMKKQLVLSRKEIQEKIFGLLGIEAEEAQEKFGFLLDAFKYGAPPHAGFAFGMDRLTALLAGEENIREVIAYPKTQSGADPLTSAPNPIDDKHLTELGLRVLPSQQ